MDNVIISLIETLGASAPTFVVLVVGIYIILHNQKDSIKEQQKQREEFVREIDNVKTELSAVKEELHKVNMFYCYKITCTKRHPSFGSHETKN